MNREQQQQIKSPSPWTMAADQSAQKSLLDALYCEEEEQWDDGDDLEEQDSSEITSDNSTFFDPTTNLSLFPLEQDLFWDDEELQSLFTKEQETYPKSHTAIKEPNFLLSHSRKEAVEWILKINAHYGFTALTTILAVNYLDRFLNTLTSHKEDEKPWMMQLAAVTCLSLAAKVEETHVPLLLDLQVEGTKYVFEAKTIQRMELLVLSSLKWRMNPVTPLSFLDHIIRRLGLKSYVHWEFLRSSENLLLSVISDSRSTGYLPSVLATATMLHVIHQVQEPSNAIDYENQLLGVLKICKEEVDDCYELISDILSNSCYNNHLKRKYCQFSSPSGALMDDFYSSNGDSSSWGVFKKSKVQEQQMKLQPSLGRSLFVDALKSLN